MQIYLTHHAKDSQDRGLWTHEVRAIIDHISPRSARFNWPRIGDDYLIDDRLPFEELWNLVIDYEVNTRTKCEPSISIIGDVPDTWG
jgi:hypothetical protein